MEDNKELDELDAVVYTNKEDDDLKIIGEIYYVGEKGFSEIEFEWDEEKALINLQKHGISFEMAILVFQDENRIEYYDYLHSWDEDRYVTIGMVQGILSVVYTERGDRIRMISARKATEREERNYYGQNDNL